MRALACLVAWVSVVLVLLAAPGYAQLTAPMRDQLQIDQNSDGQANPGDTLRYSITITNPPAAPPATDIQFTDTPDANTTLVPGSVHSTPIAFDQTVTTNEATAVAITLTGFDPILSGTNLAWKLLTVSDRNSQAF